MLSHWLGAAWFKRCLRFTGAVAGGCQLTRFPTVACFKGDGAARLQGSQRLEIMDMVQYPHYTDEANEAQLRKSLNQDENLLDRSEDITMTVRFKGRMPKVGI